MNCHNEDCECEESRVIDSRKDAYIVKRVRGCKECSFRWNTIELEATEEVYLILEEGTMH